MTDARLIPTTAMTAVAVILGGPLSAQQPAKAPTAFIENIGQWTETTEFVARCNGMIAHFENRAIALQLPKRTDDGYSCRVLRLSFENATKDIEVRGAARLPGAYSYASGRAWHSGARSYRRLLYDKAWEGVDLQVREQSGRLEYDLLLAPGASLAEVTIRCAGVDGIRVDERGRLVMTTAEGSIVQTPPVAWQVGAHGERRPVDCRFRRIDQSSYGFAIEGLDDRLATVVDPGLEWGTYVGSSGYDYADEVHVAEDGTVTIAGYTASTRFPTKAGSYDTTFNGNIDAFVTRLAADGKSLIYSTFLGGGGRDWVTGLAVSKTGEVTAVGYTESRNFPTTFNALSRTYAGAGDGFALRLAADGKSLRWSTYLGGTGYEIPNAAAVAANGSVTIVGWTNSRDFPVSGGAYDTSYSAAGDAFVTRIDNAGRGIEWSTFVGGKDYDPVYDVELDASGNAVVVGETYGSTKDFTTTPGAFDRTYNGGKSDTVVFQISRDGRILMWSTFLGGSSWDPGYALTLDEAGNPTIAGESWSTDLPVTANAYQKTNAGNGDGYVAKLSRDGSKLLWATFLGGKNGEEQARGITIDPFGALIVTGWTKSSDFPKTPGAMRDYVAKGDGFVSRLAGDGSALWYSTLFGASGFDQIHSSAVSTDGSALLAGEVWWTDFPISPNAYDATYNDGGDAYACRIDLLPTGTARFGKSTPACTTVAPIGVTAEPRAGTTDFALVAASGPPSSAGFALIGGGRFASGVPILGVLVHIDLTKPTILLPVLSDPQGRSSAPLPLPNGTQGARLYSQFIWLNTAGCGGAGTFSASGGLDWTVR